MTDARPEMTRSLARWASSVLGSPPVDREPGRHLGAACDADAAVPGGDGGPVGVYGAALEADVTCYLGVCGAVGLYRDDAFCAAVNGAGAWASDGDGPGGDALDAHVGGGVFRANGVFSHQVDGGLSRHKEVIRSAAARG